MPERYRPILAAFLLMVLAAPLQCVGETSEEVQQRLEQYRQHDAEAAREKARQAAEAALRREQTRQWQERRRLEEYARRWKPYGDQEVDVLSWRQQNDGTWVTIYNVIEKKRRTDSEPLPTPVAPLLHPLLPPDSTAAQPLLPSLSLMERYQGAVEEYRRYIKSLTGVMQSPLGPASPPRRFDQALEDLVREGVVTLREYKMLRGLSSVPQVSLLGVNCTSLMVNRNPAGQGWGSWTRPAEGSYDEQLVVDRCAAVKP